MLRFFTTSKDKPPLKWGRVPRVLYGRLMRELMSLLLSPMPISARGVKRPRSYSSRLLKSTVGRPVLSPTESISGWGRGGEGAYILKDRRGTRKGETHPHISKRDKDDSGKKLAKGKSKGKKHGHSNGHSK